MKKSNILIGLLTIVTIVVCGIALLVLHQDRRHSVEIVEVPTIIVETEIVEVPVYIEVPTDIEPHPMPEVDPIICITPVVIRPPSTINTYNTNITNITNNQMPTRIITTSGTSLTVTYVN